MGTKPVSTDKAAMPTHEKTITAEGHLIDSDLMRQIFDVIITDGGRFEMIRFEVGRTNDEMTQAAFKLFCDDAVRMNTILLKLSALGCQIDIDREATLKPAPADGVVPPDFYSSTNHDTEIYLGGEWRGVENIRMDGVIVVGSAGQRSAVVRKFRDIQRGDLVACGLSGIRVRPDFVERQRSDFGFMSSEVSTERKVRLVVERVARLIGEKKRKIVWVCGPVAVHTGGSTDLSQLIRNGHIDALLAGNALAVHDIEAALYGTSLGIDLSTGAPVEMGHRNHLRAINEVRRAGSIAELVAEGTLQTGIMHALVEKQVPFSLAGSLRDDGPLPETITDMNRAQEDHARLLDGTDVVLMLATMLHSIAVGNMIPARVLTVCVDINPAVVTKLKDRGSHQTIGVVTDVGLFLHLLAEQLAG